MQRLHDQASDLHRHTLRTTLPPTGQERRRHVFLAALICRLVCGEPATADFLWIRRRMKWR